MNNSNGGSSGSWGPIDWQGIKPGVLDTRGIGNILGLGSINSQNQSDPNANDITSVAGGGSGRAASGGGTSAANAQETAYWDDQIGSLNRILGNIGTQEAQGVERINDSYNKAMGRANEDQSRVLRDYGIQEDTTKKGKVNALDAVDSSARNTYNSLQRILGLSGAGVSSASNELAPWAVSKEATGKRTGVVDTFGANLGALARAKDDAQAQFGRITADLGEQRGSKEEDFRRGIEQNRQGVNEQLGDAAMKRKMATGSTYTQARDARAPFQSAVQNSQNTLNELFNRYSNTNYNVGAINAQKPDLSAYNVDPMSIGSQTGNTPAEVASYLPWLRKDDKTGF